MGAVGEENNPCNQSSVYSDEKFSKIFKEVLNI